MAQFKEERSQIGSPWAWGISPALANPMMVILSDVNCAFMEALATAQKDWADFVQQRIREDVTVGRRLINCQSLPDMQQIYSQYLQTAFDQYRQQCEKLARRSESIAQHLGDATEASAREAARVRH
jgi:hypothetical protein